MSSLLFDAFGIPNLAFRKNLCVEQKPVQIVAGNLKIQNHTDL